MSVGKCFFYLSAICLSAMLVVFSSSVHADPSWEICGWCSNDSDFKAFAESKGHTRAPGLHTYYIGNPHNEVLRKATVSVDNEPWGKLVIAYVEAPPVQYQNDFKAVSAIATTDEVIVIPSGACSSCGSFIEAYSEPDFFAYLYQVYASDIISDLSSRNNFIVYLVKSYFFGIHDTLVVVFPNGDSVKVDIISIVPVPGSLAMQSGSAVDADGNPLDGQGNTDHHQGSSGGGGGSFYARVSSGVGLGGGVQWYLCGPDGNGGYSCVKIPPPEEEN